MYKYVKFTPLQKKKVIQFLEKLSIDTRNRLSVSGIDPQTIYSSFKYHWLKNMPVCLYYENEIIALGKFSNEKGKGYLSCIVVRDDYQRQGIGTRLVKYLYAIAIFDGCHKIYTEVKNDNLVGISFFKRLGFKIIERKEYTYLMEKILF